MDWEPTVNDLFDAMGDAGRRIKDTSAFRQAFVLYDFNSGAASDWVRAIFKRFYSAHIESHRCIELKRPPARSRFGTAEHDAYLFPQLINEYCGGLCLAERAGNLAQGLGHEPGLQADVT